MRAITLAVFLCGYTAAADPTEADKAITKAIADLKTAGKEANSKDDREKLAKAVAALEAILAPAKLDNDKLVELIDSPEKFEGKKLTLRLRYGNTSEAETLRDRIGRSATFEGSDPKSQARLLIVIEIPEGLDVPKAKWNEILIVTFECKNGSLTKGNVASKVSRPN